MTEQRIELLDDLAAELARVGEQEANRPPTFFARLGRLRRLAPARAAVAIALACLVLLAGAAYTVPVSRAVVEDFADSFVTWVEGNDDAAPGRALRPGDDAPAWVEDQGGRLIAEASGVGLYATRTETEGDTQLTLVLDGGVALSDSIDGWRERFDEKALAVLGPAFIDGNVWDSRGRFPLGGASARSVERVEVRYASGPPLTKTGVRGGFVVMVDARRALREVVAYSATGQELERVDLSHIDLRRHCFDERGCPPGRFAEPGDPVP